MNKKFISLPLMICTLMFLLIGCSENTKEIEKVYICNTISSNKTSIENPNDFLHKTESELINNFGEPVFLITYEENLNKEEVTSFNVLVYLTANEPTATFFKVEESKITKILNDEMNGMDSWKIKTKIDSLLEE